MTSFFSRKKKIDDEYYLRPPRDQYFYHFMANMMSMFSAGDREQWGYPKRSMLQIINSHIMTIFGPICSISQFTYLYCYFSDLSFAILGTIYAIIPVTGLAVANIYCIKFKSYKRITKTFLATVHLHNVYEKNKSEFVKQKLITLEKITRWTILASIVLYSSAIFGWNLIPAINNYKYQESVLNHTRKLQNSLYLWMPFDYNYDYRNWIIMHSINCYVVLCGVCSTMTVQCQNYMFVYNLIGHLHVLKNSLRTGFTVEMNDKQVHEKLKQIIEHHTFIIKIFEEVQNAFGFNVACTYLQNFLSNSIVMYQIMYGARENLLLYITMGASYIGVPVLMSFVLEEIRKESDDLPDIVYSIPWQTMSVSNQKTVKLILQRTQNIMVFVAFGGIEAGVAPMVSILKTTFSYYVMLESSVAT